MVTLSITIDDRGQVSINGPIENQLLCYGLLEVARDTIREHNARKTSPVIAPSGEDVRALSLHHG